MFITVWKQNFTQSERLPVEAVKELHAQGIIKVAFKPNTKGRLKPVYVSLDVISKLRDLSASMGPRVTERITEGSRYHMELAKSWA